MKYSKFMEWNYFSGNRNLPYKSTEKNLLKKLEFPETSIILVVSD